jgi:hypothetical protein
LLIYSGSDLAVAERIGQPSLISEDLAFERWDAMVREAKLLDTLGLKLEVNLAIVPPRLRQQTEYNEAWNMRTLIMMARARMLDMDASAPDLLPRAGTEDDETFDRRADTYWSDYYMRCIVDLHEAGHRDKAVFVSRIQSERARSFRAAEDNANLLHALVGANSEVGTLLQRLYQSYKPGRSVVVATSCGGCPLHRREAEADADYAEPAVFGVSRIQPQDLGDWRKIFPYLSQTRTVFLLVPDAMDVGAIGSVLGDAVALFNVKEIATSQAFRDKTPGLRMLHKKAKDGFLMLQNLDLEYKAPPPYPVARISVLMEGNVPSYLLDLERPLHIIVAPTSTPDPWHPGRRLGEVGSNVLTLEQFRSGTRL